MTINQKLSEIIENARYAHRRGAFYSSPGGRPLGRGVILRDCTVPFFDHDAKKFLTGKGFVCVLTHECDIDENNERPFNDKLLIAPIMDFEIWYDVSKKALGEEAAQRVAVDIVKDQIFRVFYLPTVPGTTMAYGGLIYFNEITNIRVDEVDFPASGVCELTEYSSMLLKFKLENHLFRPKSAPPMRIN